MYINIYKLSYRAPGASSHCTEPTGRTSGPPSGLWMRRSVRTRSAAPPGVFCSLAGVGTREMLVVRQEEGCLSTVRLYTSPSGRRRHTVLLSCRRRVCLSWAAEESCSRSATESVRVPRPSGETFYTVYLILYTTRAELLLREIKTNLHKFHNSLWRMERQA